MSGEEIPKDETLTQICPTSFSIILVISSGSKATTPRKPYSQESRVLCTIYLFTLSRSGTNYSLPFALILPRAIAQW